MRSVVLAEVVLQFLQGAATGFWAELPDKQERDRINEREQAEGQRRTQRPHQQREDEGDDRVRGPEMNTAVPIAKPRMVIGKISESSSQINVPINVWTKNTTTSIPTRIR